MIKSVKETAETKKPGKKKGFPNEEAKETETKR